MEQQKIQRVFFISIANYIDVGIDEGGTSNGDDGVGYEVSHNKLVDKEFKEDGEELLGVEAYHDKSSFSNQNLTKHYGSFIVEQVHGLFKKLMIKLLLQIALSFNI